MLTRKIWLKGERCSDVVDDDLGNDDVYGVADDVDDVVDDGVDDDVDDVDDDVADDVVDVVVLQGGVAVQQGWAQGNVVDFVDDVDNEFDGVIDVDVLLMTLMMLWCCKAVLHCSRAWLKGR